MSDLRSTGGFTPRGADWPVGEPDSRPGAPQIAIVLKDGQWFIRRIAWTHQDDVNGEMVYHCDENLGGPFASWRDMANTVDAYLLKTT